MIEQPKKRGGQPGNKGGKGRPKSKRPLSGPRQVRLYEDQMEWFNEQGGVDYLRWLVDQKIPMHPPEQLIV